MKVALDANIILRLITDDEPAQSRKAAEVFGSAAKGKLELWVTPPVLFEVSWTLRRAYGSSREEVLKALADLCSTPGVALSDQAVVEQALATAQSTGLEFADAYIVAAAADLGIIKVATFNVKDFKRTAMELLPL
jgi:predicted nucleic acid-binding protein